MPTKTRKLVLILSAKSITFIHLECLCVDKLIRLRACNKVASDSGFDHGFHCVIRISSPLTFGQSKVKLKHGK